MITYKELEDRDIGRFWDFLNTLDAETSCMMYEPGERKQRTDIRELRTDLHDNVINGDDFLQIAAEGDKIVGYLRAERGKCNRILHTAYIVVGILEGYRGRGIGTAFFAHLDEWAREKGVLRLELTVECRNTAARHLYEKSGFQIEGTRAKSMLVEGTLMDEYSMAKLI